MKEQPGKKFEKLTDKKPTQVAIKMTPDVSDERTGDFAGMRGGSIKDELSPDELRGLRQDIRQRQSEGEFKRYQADQQRKAQLKDAAQRKAARGGEDFSQ